MKNLSDIKYFFEINFQNKQFYREIFENLQKLIKFDAGKIYFINPKKIVYEYNNSPKTQKLSADLKIKNTKFGEIEIFGEKFSKEDKNIFELCSYIISNIIKDNELSKIMKLQVETLHSNYKEVKNEEEIKTKFLSYISHELRTPLNSILGYSDILENEFIGKLNKKQKEYISNIKVSGINLLEMINEILDITKIEAKALQINRSEFYISVLINEVENTLKSLFINKNIKLTKEITDFKINADYTKIQQVLFNIISNAIKYTSRNGEITISTRLTKNNVQISVKDNGIGIDKKYHKKIFEKFEQINQNTPNSTGLGLAIANELIKIHNGNIKLKSQLGKGSTFTIILPINKNMI